MDATIVSSETSRIKPTIDVTYDSALSRAVEDTNRTVTRGVFVNEVASLYLLDRHNVATTTLADQVLRNRGRVVQSHGSPLTQLVDGENPHATYVQLSGTRRQSDGFRIPETTLEAIKRHYSQWHVFFSEAFEWYFSQPFESVAHLLEVQLDVLDGDCETDLGAQVTDTKWFEVFQSSEIADWQEAYDNNTSKNTTQETKADIIDRVCDQVVSGTVSKSRAERVVRIVCGIHTQSSIDAIVSKMESVQEQSTEANVEAKMNELV